MGSTVHWRRYDGGLSSSFWAFIDSLEEMSRRWSGDFGSAGSDGSSLFSQFATRLRKLHDLCESDTHFRSALLEYADEIINEEIWPRHRLNRQTNHLKLQDISLRAR